MNKPALSKSNLQILLVAIFIILALLFIAFVNNYSSSQMLKQEFYLHGVSLTNSLSGSIWEKLRYKTDGEPETILKKTDYHSMDVGVRRVIEGTPVLKLKLYDQKGVMKYSSNVKDIKFGDGDDLQVVNKVNLITLDVIKNRKPFASYDFRTVFDDGERQYYDRYIMSVYLPAKSKNSEKIGGVVEIYYDVTDIINNFKSNRNISNAILACTGLVLVILIGYLIKRAEKESQYKYLQREKYLNLIKHKNQDLIRKTKELRKIKERAERLVDEKSAFLSRMSHELRTPMNAVIGLTDLVMRTSLTDKQKGYINAIQSSGSMLLDITDEILTIGRLETGCLELKSQKFVIREVIENVVEVLSNRAASHNIELLCDCDFLTQTTVIGDPVRLRQILLNLVSNAIRHTDTKGNVLIKAIHNKGNFGSEHYHFEVSDTGVGISEDDQRRIFAAYCHLNITTKAREKNTGLGLAICKRLVEVMNGAIGVNSSPGKGSTFWFKLPLHTEHSSQLLEKNIESKLPKNSRILVVMENLEAANNMILMLGWLGASVDMVNTYDEAIEYIEQSFVELKPYSLFIVDARINGECGIRLSKHIRTYSALDKVSIVIMVPISESLGKGVISNIGKTVCINKPVLPSRLIKLIFNLHTNNPINESYNGVGLNGEQSSGKCLCASNVNYRVLVAEDNPVNRELMIEMLTELNVKHDAVENGHGVLNKVMDKHYDLILMDSRLPDLDGHEVSSRIRSMKTVAKQPVIIATSSDNSLKNQQLSLESGVDDFLNKPITMNELTAKLNAWLPFNDLDITKENNNEDSTVVNLFSAPILDLNILEALRERDENNAGFMNKLFGIFIDDTFERIELLKKQLADSEYVHLSKTIHSIKSGCDHIGAKRMSRYCSVISNMARNQSYAETQRALQHFIEEFDRVIIELNKEMEYEVTT